jgi:hypothetical protein
MPDPHATPSRPQHALDREGSWAAYSEAEYRVSRAQAYRLIDISRASGAISTAVTTSDAVSRTRDTDTAAAFDWGLSQRALLAVAGRVEEVTDLITRRLAALPPSGGQELKHEAVRAIVRQAVQDAVLPPR